MDLGLQGKHAIVTGGSRGIGKAIARELAREGVDVAIAARNKGDLETTARELAAETNRRIVPLAADVTSTEQVDRMVAEAAQQLGGLHILVNSGSAPGGSTRSSVAGQVRSGLVWGFSCQAVVLGCADSFLFGAGKAVFRPVACNQVPGARGRGQGTETLAELGGLPPSVACVSQRLDA